jgi:hypothetical protein
VDYFPPAPPTKREIYGPITKKLNSRPQSGGLIARTIPFGPVAHVRVKLSEFVHGMCGDRKPVNLA